MARCDCSRICSCVFEEGANITITGTGSPTNPYVISAAGGGGGGGGGDWSPGDIKMYAGLTLPGGWLRANGQAVSRTTYADLFAAIGTIYGPGDGSSSFNLPDLAGRFPLGADGAHAAGATGGSFTTILSTANIPAHAHTMAHTHSINHSHGNGYTDYTGDHDHEIHENNASGTNSNSLRRGDAGATNSRDPINGDGTHQHVVYLPAFVGSSGGSSAPNTGSVGSGTAFDTTPPWTAVNFLIHV